MTDLIDFIYLSDIEDVRRDVNADRLGFSIKIEYQSEALKFVIRPAQDDVLDVSTVDIAL
jgi:hypothetical protein